MLGYETFWRLGVWYCPQLAVLSELERLEVWGLYRDSGQGLEEFCREARVYLAEWFLLTED